MALVCRVDNPVSEVDDYRMEVLMRLPQLDTLDKDEFVADDKHEALAAYEERKDELDLEDVIPDEQVRRHFYSLMPLFI